MVKNLTKTLVIDNFWGSMSSYTNGDINSGWSNVVQQSGPDPFTRPGQLTWSENPVRIDSGGSVITDLILCARSRVEGNIIYVYAVGHTGRIYKIQVNDPATYNPNYDNPVLLTTIISGTPTFTRGGFIDFFGSTERMYIGHDKGVTRLDFDGTNETVVGVVGSWTQTVPRPLQQFLGKLYAGNGVNIAEINDGGTVLTYTKLSPAFPIGTQVRDLDVTPDGNYIQAVVSKTGIADITLTTPNYSTLSPADSYIFKWNGIDAGYTSFITYASTILSANVIFGNIQYVFGFDNLGGAIYNPIDKYLTSTTLSAYMESPSPNAIVPISGAMYWMTPLVFQGSTYAMINMFGTISGYELKGGFFCPFVQLASGTETDVNRIPCVVLASNFAQGTSFNGYTGTNYGAAKLYFSVLESSSGTTAYKLYKWTTAPTGLGTAITSGIYQTQTQLFSKKIKISEVRIYGEPWLTNNSFTIDLIGPDHDVAITGASKTFTAGSDLTVGNDFAWYTPEAAPTYALGVRVTNLGTANFVISKIEIDYTEAGK